MKLRTQLLLVSLSILGLPWAGYQFISGMEQVFLEAQSRELIGRGKAIAAHLQSQTETFSHQSTKFSARDQLYFHPLNNPPNLDGSLNEDWPTTPLGDRTDWQLPTIDNRTFAASSDPSLRIAMLSGLHNGDAYFYFSVIDKNAELHDPRLASIATGDHFVFRLYDGTDNTQTYILRASGQGPCTARYINGEGHIRQEHRIQGFWRVTSQGHQVELIIPQGVLTPNIDFSYVKTDGTTVGTLRDNFPPPPWVTTHGDISSLIQLYDDYQTRIEVVDSQGWLLGQSGRIRETASSSTDSISWQWFLNLLYQSALTSTQLPIMDVPYRLGRMDSIEVQQALNGEEQETKWYQRNGERIARTAIPIRRAGYIVGAVAITQSTASLTADISVAFNRLFYSLGIAIFGFPVCLLAYAAILNFRIRRLNKATDNAITEDGKINSTFIQSKFNDEIGDLTRSYGQLLSRLHDYTDYLQSLASKLSHELRTPLAVVRSSLENLDYENGGEEAGQYRQRAKEGAERLANILAAMSSASRMEDSIRNTPMEDFFLDQLLLEVGEAYRSTYTNNNIVLDIAKEADFSLHGSPDLIVQMLDKLVDNAADFCPAEGEIRITLNRGKNSLLLSVSNTGPLLPKHMQGQLFDSLVSVRESKTSGNKTHLGLGLYIVRLIVEFHGGQVQGRNMDNNNGVSFDIRLPALVVD